MPKDKFMLLRRSKDREWRNLRFSTLLCVKVNLKPIQPS